MKQRCAIYARVSANTQSVANQVPVLAKMAEQRGYRIVEIYEETASGRKHKPVLDRMIHDAHRAKFDVIMIWALDRIDRRMLNTIQLVLRLDALGVRLLSHEESWLDTTGPARNLLLAVASWVLEAEVERVRERTRLGLERARRRGSRIGRPPAQVDLARVIELRDSGMSFRAISREVGVGASTVHRVLRAHETLNAACSETGSRERVENGCISAGEIAPLGRSKNERKRDKSHRSIEDDGED